MLSGVKQGCPLSPLLFNMVMDELLVTLPREHGYALEGQKVNNLAFADDITLVSHSAAGMSNLLRKAEEFFAQRGLRVNTRKSLSLAQTTAQGRRRKVVKKNFKIANEVIPSAGIESVAKYLGLSFSHAGRPNAEISRLESMLTRLDSSCLKGRQRLEVIGDFIVPHLGYYWRLERVSKGLLAKADAMIRRMVKKWLHLPISTSTDWMYLPRRQGGLGVTALSEFIPRSKLGMLKRLASDRDPIVRSCVTNKEWVREERLCLSMLGLPLRSNRKLAQEMCAPPARTVQGDSARYRLRNPG